MDELLSDYIIKETIGKGTFSIVKLGINKITKEKVAIKILKKNKIIHREDVERIEREISILKKLSHINVIKIHKINEDEEKYYIFMEYCENGELFHYIVERQRLTEEESSFFFYQLINGLEYIHSENIVHRDLKPENLLLGKNNILKIIDFGLSNFCEVDNFLETPCGSPCYASPEMVSGKKYNGHIIDIWSTGIILFAMMCGYLPFEDQDNDILFKKILKCKIKYPEYLSENVVDLMKKILVREPEKRISLEEIKEHPFYKKGKNIFGKKYPHLVKEVEKVNNTGIKIIKNIKLKNCDDSFNNINNLFNINNLVTSKGFKDKSSFEIFNTSTKNFNNEENEDDFDYFKMVSKNLYNKINKKLKNRIKEMNDKNNYKIIEKKPEKKMGHKEIVYQIINEDNKSHSFNFNKLLNDKKKEKKEKEKYNEENKDNNNKHECQTGVAINYNIYNYNNNFNNNFNYNSEPKNNISLLQKLLNNNVNTYSNKEQNKSANSNKIILHNKNFESKSPSQKDIDKIIFKENKAIKDLFKNYKTEYKINKKTAKSQEHEKSILSKSFKSQNDSENKTRKNKVGKYSSINLKKNKYNNKEKKSNTGSNNNNINNSFNNKGMKQSLYKEIRKHNSIKTNNSNITKKYLMNFDSNNNININMNINFLSSNNNLTNNINIIKSPIKTPKKSEICISKQYTMKFDLNRLKSNNGNNKQNISNSLSGINNLNNINMNKLKNIQFNSTTNNNMNFSYMSNNNNLSPCNSNMSITSRKNNFFNHKKLLIATLNKKIKSPQPNKMDKYINISSGDFLKIRKTIISKRHKKNEMNFKNRDFSNIMSNISGSGLINLNNITSRQQKNNIKNKNKKIPLIGLNFNFKKIKQTKNNNETFSAGKKKEKEKKHISFGKGNINIKQFLTSKLNYKKINMKNKNEENDNNVITIKKVNKYNSNKQKNKVIDKRINSGNKTTVNNHNTNTKLFKGINMLLDNSKFNKKIINSNDVLVNSFIKFQRKTYNKKL